MPKSKPSVHALVHSFTHHTPKVRDPIPDEYPLMGSLAKLVIDAVVYLLMRKRMGK